MSKSPARDRTTSRALPPRCKSTAFPRSVGTARTSARRSRRRRSPCCCARASGRLRNMTDQAATDQRCGFVALIGAPNSGKSTLINALVGAKVAIVTHKAQTTRGPVLGIALQGTSQIILVDTPGIFQPKSRLDRAMSGAAWTRAAEADLVALVIDAERAHTGRRLDAWLDPVFETLATIKRPIIGA